LDGVPGFIIQKKVEKNVLFLIMVIVVWGSGLNLSVGNIQVM
jgi:hypothetical protein